MRFLILLSGLLIFSTTVLAQYPFASKDEKKLYNQLEKNYDKYEYEKILAQEENILRLFTPKQDTLTALMYSFLGEAYYYIGNTTKAYDYSKKELELRQKVDPKNTEEIKNAAFQLAQYADELGKFTEAEMYYLEVLESDRKVHGQRSDTYIETALQLANHYGYTKSLRDAQEGIKLLRSINRYIDKKDKKYPVINSQLGYLYSQTGNYRQAERHFADATKAYDALGMYASRQNVSNLNNISLYYQQVGKYPEAEKVLNEAINILNRLPGENEAFMNVLQNNIAGVYMALGNYSSAERSLKESIGMLQKVYGAGTYNEAITLTALGLNYRWQQKYDEAEAEYMKAMKILEAGGAKESFDYAVLINNLSNIYKERGDLDKALEFGTRATESFKAIVGTNDIAYVRALYNLGEINMMKGDDAKGEIHLKEAQKLGKNFLGQYHPDLGRINLKLAINQWAQGKHAEAQTLYAEVFSNYFQQIDNYFPSLSEEEKTKFYNNRLKPAFEQFNSFLVEMGRENEPMIGMMYDFQLATKGMLLYASNRVRESILSSGDSVLINKYFTWTDQMEELSKLYSSTGAGVEERNKKIDSLYTAANRLEKELSEASVAFSGTYSQNRQTWKDVKAKLKKDEAAIEIVRFRNFSPKNGGKYTDETIYGALVVKHNTELQPDLILMRNGNQLESRAITTYRNAIRYRMDEDYSYRFFWKPIAGKLGNVKKVYFSPDGIYNQVSMYTLFNPETNKFLIDEIDFHVLTNTKDLIQFAKGDAPTDLSDKPLLFGFPNYNLGIIEQSGDQQALASSVSTAASLGRGDSRDISGTRGARGVESDGESANLAFIGNTRGGAGLSRGLRGNLQRYMSGNNLMAMLPGTKVEVESIASIFTNLNRTPGLFLGDAATEEEIKGIKNPVTLHIATHGFFLENDKTAANQERDNYVENPLLRSGLIMAGANSFIAAGQISEKHEDGNDGILTAYEAMNLNLTDTDLVVLSACETGLGEITNGEGVYGLQRAFQVAGAKTIIMSMWTVDDAATQELMTTFYSEWVRTGNRQGSFITAQRKIKEKYKSPYFWGAFVMIGE